MLFNPFAIDSDLVQCLRILIFVQWMLATWFIALCLWAIALPHIVHLNITPEPPISSLTTYEPAMEGCINTIPPNLFTQGTKPQQKYGSLSSKCPNYLNLCIFKCRTATASSYTGPQLSSFLCDFCTCGSPKTSLLALASCTLCICSQRCRGNECSPRGSEHCLSEIQSFHIFHTWTGLHRSPPCWRVFWRISTECFCHSLQEER